MTLRTKVLLVIHLTAATLVLVVFFMARHMLLTTFGALEQQESLRRVEMALSTMGQQQKALRTIVQDWAAWDDSHRFAQSPYPEFVESNVVDATFADLNIDLLILTNAAGRYLIAKHFDRTNQKALELGGPLRGQLAGLSFLFRHSAIDSSYSGIVLLGDKPAMVVSLPVLTSNKTGPVAGSLLMGRFITKDLIRDLAGESLVPLDLRLVGGQGGDPDDRALARSLLKEPAVRLLVRNNDLIQGFTLIKDLTGRPALLLEISLARTAWKKARSLLVYIFVALLGSGAVVVLVSVIITEKVLLGRLNKIIHGITAIGRSGDHKARLGIKGGDELGQLAGEIDDMLQALEQARTKQLEAEYLYRAITEEAASGIFIVKDDKFQFMNPAGLRMIGYRWEDIEGVNVWDLVEPENLPEVRGYVQAREAGETAVSSVEFQFNRPDGVPRWIQLTVSPIVLRGEPCTLGTTFDITKRKLAVENVRQSEKLFRASFAAMPESLTITQIDTGRFLEVNEGFTRITGYEYDEVVHRSILDLNLYVDTTDRDRFIEALAKDGEVKGMEIDYRTKSGKVLTLSVDARPLSYQGWDCVVTVARDITPLKEAEAREKELQAELQQAQKMEAVGTLAGGVAHDFNNILQAISGYVELMRIHTSEDDRAQHKRLSEIGLATERAGGLVRDLLMFSRRMEPKRTALNLNQEVIHAVNLLERTIPRMITIETALNKDLYTVKGDAGQLEQVVLNLGANARDAMAEGGVLTIETDNVEMSPEFCREHPGLKPGPYVRLRVSDTGEGITPEDLEHIFEPFFTTKEVNKGTGLGLSTVFGIVKAHDGQVFCRNQSPSGAVFEVLLPASPEIDLPVQHDSDTRWVSDQRAMGAETILVVDDEDPIAQATREALEQYGYKVWVANSGEQALDLFDQSGAGIDLVVLDLNMPGMGGQKCLELLLGLDPDIPVVIASGYADASLAEKVFKAGAAGFINKPYRLNELVKVVRRVLDDQFSPPVAEDR